MPGNFLVRGKQLTIIRPQKVMEYSNRVFFQTKGSFLMYLRKSLEFKKNLKDTA